jgi:tetratricopeptide (TPR) repeat protein
MDQSKALTAIEILIGEGDTEKALTQLLALLDSNPDFAEFAQTVRINQADLFQIKSQVLRGTISTDNERTANNQIRDNVFTIIKQVKAGKTTFDEVSIPEPRQAWRYYVAGGVATLALTFLGWNLLNKPAKEGCPQFGKEKTMRVLILPLKKIEGQANASSEVDLSIEINNLILGDNLLKTRAEADVNEQYDINKNFPNPSEAAKIGKDCGVEMVVWGKTLVAKDTIEVRYRIVRSATSKDTSAIPNYLNNLKDISLEGVLRSDIKTIARQLCSVSAMQEGEVDIAANFLSVASNSKMVASDAYSNFTLDTSSLLLKAEAYMMSPAKKDSALQIYNEVLAYYPDNARALRGRGFYHLDHKNYTAAVQDLHSAQPDPTKADPLLLRVRTDAYLHGGWPEFARRDLEQIKKDTVNDTKQEWINNKERSIQDSIKIYEALLQESATTVKSKQPKKRTEAKLNIARANIALGNPDEAARYSENVNASEPTNITALETALEAYSQNGDIKKARQTIDNAEKKGVNTKSVKFRPAAIKPLELNKGGGN